KSASPKQMQQLQELYKERTRGELSEKHLDEVLRARDGVRLNPEVKNLADQYAKAFHDLPQRDPALNQLEDRYFAVMDEREKLSPPDKLRAAEDLIKRLSEDRGTLARSLFGSALPPEVRSLMEAYMGAGAVQTEHAYKVLKEVLDKRFSELGTARHTAIVEGTRAYYKNPTEQDAHALGIKAKLDAGRAAPSDTTGARPADVPTAAEP